LGAEEIVRVIAGKYRGRKLLTPVGEELVRPTADRVKESLFSILGSRLYGARVLDLFAGSGALGIESLSRGASEAVFNDISKESLSFVKRNLSFAEERYELMNGDFKSCLLRVTGQFDLIFADPPYKEDYLAKISEMISERGLLSEKGLLVYESEGEPKESTALVAVDKRSYGRTKIAIYGLPPKGEPS